MSDFLQTSSFIEATTAQAQSYTDFAGLAGLKSKSAINNRENLEQVAQQFESIFLNMTLKSMRQANEAFAEDSYFNSNESRMYRDMLDNQLSLTLSQGKGVGLADSIVRQLGKYLPAGGAPVAAPGSRINTGA